MMASRTLLLALGLLAFGCSAGEGDSSQCSGEDCEPASCADCGPPVETDVGRIGSHASVSLAPDGAVAVTTYELDRSALVVGRGPSLDALSFVVVDGANGGDVGWYTDCGFDAEGVLHVVYYDATQADLKHASVGPDLKVLAVETVQVEGDVGRRPSLAVAPDGALHASFYDATTRTLRYGVRSPGGGWSVETVPAPVSTGCRGCAPSGASVDYGSFSSIGLAAAPVIAYYDAAGGNLLVATLVAGGWETQVVDGVDPSSGEDTLDVGRWPSLLVDKKGNVSIAYQDVTNGALRYAFTEQGQLKVQVIDPGLRQDSETGAVWPGVVGAFASLTTTASEQPVIHYLDSTDVAVRRAVHSAGDWVLSTLPIEGATGLWLDSARGLKGNPVVTFERWNSSVGPKGTSTLERSLGFWAD